MSPNLPNNMGDICKILIQNGFRFIPHSYTISTLVCLKRFFLFYKDFASFDFCDFGRHLLHPQILRLLVVLKPADFPDTYCIGSNFKVNAQIKHKFLSNSYPILRFSTRKFSFLPECWIWSSCKSLWKSPCSMSQIFLHCLRSSV